MTYSACIGSPAGRFARRVRGLVAALTLVSGTLAWAQYQTSLQVNPQVNQGSYPGINNAPGPTYDSLRYMSQAPGQNAINNPMLQSQVNFMNVQSGNLPSQIRYSQIAAGPLAPVVVQTPRSAEALAAAARGGANANAPSGALTAGPSGSIRYSQVSAPLAPGQVSSQITYNTAATAVPVSGPAAAPMLNNQLNFPSPTAAAANGSLRYNSPGYNN
jgi:hypothetical protein